MWKIEAASNVKPYQIGYREADGSVTYPVKDADAVNTTNPCAACALREYVRKLLLNPHVLRDELRARVAVMMDVIRACPNPVEYSDAARFHRDVERWREEWLPKIEGVEGA